ncbi:MAG: flippase [Patescibacteria group bacterium]
MSTGAKIAKNASWLVVAMSLSKLIAFLYFYVIARLLGPHVTGVFFFAVSITSIFTVIADLGVTQVIIRAVASARADAEKLYGAAVRLKLIMTPVAILVSLGYGLIKGADAVTMQAIALACLVMAADTFHLLMYGSLRGKQNLRPEALGMLVGQALTACFSISAAFLGWGPVGLVGGLLLGSAWNLGWAFFKTRTYNIHAAAITFADVSALMREALPFTVAGFAVKTYSYVDTLFIEHFHGITAVGIYAVAYKLTYALQFIPMTIMAALYPAFADAWSKHEHEKLRANFLGALRFMAFLGFSLSAGLSALAPRIIPLAYGDKFLAAIEPFRILPWVLLPIFMDFPIGSLLNATHRAHQKTIAMVATMLLNVGLNLILVPSYGPLGAAWAGLVSFTLLFLIGVWFTRRDGGWLTMGSIVLRALVAAGLAWTVWKYLGDVLPFPVAFTLGTCAALILAFIFRLLTWQDLRFIKNLRKPAQVQADIHEDAS